jgi:hypothetical protein
MELKNLRKHIDTLATLPESDAEVISCYLTLKDGRLTDRNVLDARKRQLMQGVTVPARQESEDALGRIEEYLATGLLPDARGIALFARAGTEPFFLPLQFRVPLPNWIAVDITPNIYHLVELKDTYHRYIVMVSTEESVRILEVNLGAVTAELWKDRPELRKRMGREWTKNHYQCHRRDRTQRFIKEKIKILDKLMSAGGYSHLILAGNSQITAQVAQQLPKHLAAKLIDTVPASGGAQAADIVEATISSFVQEEEDESRLAAGEVIRAVRTGGLAAVGVGPTFQALQQGRVDMLVLAQEFGPDPGWQCANCGKMEVEVTKPTQCRQCEAGEFRSFDVREEMVRLAERNRCAIEVVEEGNSLMLHGGVGCLLQYRLASDYVTRT